MMPVPKSRTFGVEQIKPKMKYLIGLLLFAFVVCRDPESTFKHFDGDDSHALTIDEFENIFLQFDTNGDRNITKHEFIEGWHHFDFNDEDHAAFDFFELDRNFDQVVEADPDLKYLFHFFDDDSDGVVDIHEYKKNWDSLFDD